MGASTSWTGLVQAWITSGLRIFSRHFLVLTCLIVFSLWLYESSDTLLQSQPSSSPADASPEEVHEDVEESHSEFRTRRHWPGWEGISHMVIFGDSYSETQFRIDGEQPSTENPFGNPPLEEDASMNRPKWIDYLVTNSNDSFIKAVNFAYGGATLDQALVPTFLNWVQCFEDQVHKSYLPHYAEPSSTFDWHSDNTLFVAWIGINDVGNIFRWKNGSDVLRVELAEYASMMDEIYQTGARNFLFMNVPPVNHAPICDNETPEAVATQGEFIANWNVGVAEIALNLSTIYDDVTATIFDVHDLYTRVLDDKCIYEETCAYKNTDGYCIWYAVDVSKSWDHFLEGKCEYPLEDYFWKDLLHPSWRINKVTAQLVAQHLRDIPSNNWDQR